MWTCPNRDIRGCGLRPRSVSSNAGNCSSNGGGAGGAGSVYQVSDRAVVGETYKRAASPSPSPSPSTPPPPPPLLLPRRHTLHHTSNQLSTHTKTTKKVRAKIEGLEALLPGMDGLALVGSRPHLLGFDVRRNVSLKVSRLRELMMDQSLPQQRRGQQETSTMVGRALRLNGFFPRVC